MRRGRLFSKYVATSAAAFTSAAVLMGALESCKPKSKSSTMASVTPENRVGFLTWWLTITPTKETPGEQRLQCLYYYENTLKWFSESEEANSQALFRRVTAQNPNAVKLVNARPLTIKQVQDEAARVGIVARALYADAAKNKVAIPGDEELSQNEILIRSVQGLDALNRSPAPYTCPEPPAIAAGLQVAEQSDPSKFKVTVVSSEAVTDDGQPIKSSAGATQSFRLAGASYVDASAPLRWLVGNFGDDALRSLGNVAKGWAGDVLHMLPSKAGNLVDDAGRGLTSVVVKKVEGQAGRIAATETRQGGSLVVRETTEGVLRTAERETVETGANAAAKSGSNAARTGTQAGTNGATSATTSTSKAITGNSTSGVRQLAAGEARFAVEKPVAILDNVADAALKKEIEEIPQAVTGVASAQVPGSSARLSARVDRMMASDKFRQYMKTPGNEQFAEKFERLYSLVSNSGRDQVEHLARVDVLLRTPKFANLESEVFTHLKSVKISAPRPPKPPIPEPPVDFPNPPPASGASSNPLYTKVEVVPNAPANAPPPNATSAISDIELYRGATSLRAPKAAPSGNTVVLEPRPVGQAAAQVEQNGVRQGGEVIDAEVVRKTPFQHFQDFWRNKFANNRARGVASEKMDVGATEAQGSKPRVSFFGRFFRKKVGVKELTENVEKARQELAQAANPEAKAAAEAALKAAEEALKKGKGGWLRGARNLAASMAIYSVATPVLQQMAPQIFGGAPGQPPADVTLSSEDDVPWINAENQLAELQDPPPPEVEEIKQGLAAAGQALGKDVSVIMNTGAVEEREALAHQLETQLQICWPVAVCVASMTATGDLTPCTERACNDPLLNK